MNKVIILFILLFGIDGANAQGVNKDGLTQFQYYMLHRWDDWGYNSSKPMECLPLDTIPKTKTSPFPDTVTWFYTIKDGDTIMIRGYGPWECGHRKVIFKKRAQ